MCSNSDHYAIINSNCTLFACSLRTPKTSGSNRCGDDCYLEGNSCVSYCQTYSKPINNFCINCANITADNESSCSDIIGCYFESGEDKCLLEECTKYNVIECASVPNCTVIKGICLEVIIEKINSTAVGNAVGGIFIKYINIYYFYV
jgi:hypothetical protein